MSELDKKKIRSPPYETDYIPQFTWVEVLMLLYFPLMYLVTWAICISIIIEKYRDKEETAASKGLYLTFFIVPHLLAGINNMLCHYRDINNGLRKPSWIVQIIFLPFSPVIRYITAFNYGRQENGTKESSVRFVNECVAASVLRFFDTILGCAPFAILLIRDDVWNRKEDWQLLFLGTNPSMTAEEVVKPRLGWPSSRILILMSQVALSLTFYNLTMKRLQHLEHPEYFEDATSSSAKSGRVNIFGCAVYFLANYTFVSSRIIGYSMVLTTAGYYFVMIVCLKWFANFVWQTHIKFYSEPSIIFRTISSLSTGLIWLYGLTNKAGGYQLGRYIVFYTLATVETSLCCTIWFVHLRGSGNLFTTKAIWVVVGCFLISIALLLFYYAVCHTGSPSVSRRGLVCGAGDRREGVSRSFHKTRKFGSHCYRRHNTV